MPTTARTIRFVVSFPGYRKKDLLGEGKKLGGLYKELFDLKRDLTLAANKLITVLWATNTGILPAPEHPVSGKPKPLRTLAYNAIKQKDPWNPTGTLAYKPTGRPMGSAVRLGIAGMVFTRINKDASAVLTGQKSLATFKKLPIPFAGTRCVQVQDSNRILLRSLWSGRNNNNLVVSPVRLDGGSKSILKRIASGEYKAGDAKLQWDERKRKWMLSISWTGEVQARDGDLVAGVDLGMATTAYIGYTDSKGKALYPRDQINIPNATIRGWTRLARERSQRLRSNRTNMDLRAGRGRDRKLRVVQGTSDKLGRMVDTTIRQVAAGVVKTAIRRGASLLVLEDLKGWSIQKMFDDTEGLKGRKRAHVRKKFLQWHQGALQAAIKNAADREGLKCIDVQAAYTSKTCSSCGIIWTTTDAKTVAKRLDEPVNVQASGAGFGRVSQAKFKCSCGHEANADHNASINIARRGLKAITPKATAA